MVGQPHQQGLPYEQPVVVDHGGLRDLTGYTQLLFGYTGTAAETGQDLSFSGSGGVGGVLDSVTTGDAGGAPLAGGADPGGVAGAAGGGSGGGAAGGGAAGGELPFTGFAAGAVAGLGAAVTVAGTALRRATRR